MLSAIWAGGLAYLAARGDALSVTGAALDVLRDAAWFFFLVTLINTQGEIKAFSGKALSILGAGLGALCVLLVGTAFYAQAYPLSGTWLQIGHFLVYVMLAVAGMALVEQLFRNMRNEERWGAKFLCLGVGGMFGYDFYLFADAMLLQS
ncbi:MAG: hypothetical protein ACREUA_02445, partial [Burkholderiales bacterium]